MSKKVVFIDIDGTLVDHTGLVPASAADACRAARKNGHKLVLCTGRSKPEIYDYILDIGFDGIISGNGACVFTDEGTLYHQTFPEDLAVRLRDFFEQQNLAYYVETNHGLYASAGLKETVLRMFTANMAKMGKEIKDGSLLDNFFGILKEGETHRALADINKICVYTEDAAKADLIDEAFGGEVNYIRYNDALMGKDSGEMSLPGVNKGVAIRRLAEHWGVAMEDTMAIGDGTNDAEMLTLCAVGIAMGNAGEALKAIADDVTADADAGGLALAFQKYALA